MTYIYVYLLITGIKACGSLCIPVDNSVDNVDKCIFTCVYHAVACFEEIWYNIRDQLNGREGYCHESFEFTGI